MAYNAIFLFDLQKTFDNPSTVSKQVVQAIKRKHKANISESKTTDDLIVFNDGSKCQFMDNQIHLIEAFKPKDIRTNHDFMSSVFKNSESETILRNIVLFVKAQNPEEWTPFSWEQYKAFCTHRVYDSEKGVLDAFVNGGKPVVMTSAWLTPGWLDFDGEFYSFTFKMKEMLGERYNLSDND